MTAKLILFLLLAGLVNMHAYAQNKLLQVQGHFSTMKVDERGQVFLLTENAVHLYNRQGHNIAVQKFQNGIPVSIEMSDENEVYLFFKGSSHIQVTGPGLSSRRNLNLENSGILNPGPACYVGLGKIWLYDKDTEKFLLLDHNLEVQRQSEPLSNFAFHTLKPIAVTYYKNHLFINNDGHEVLVFNRFGTYVNRMDVRTNGQLQISDDKIYFVRNGRPYVADVFSGRVTEYHLPYNFATVREYLEKNNNLYILSYGGLSIYQK